MTIFIMSLLLDAWKGSNFHWRVCMSSRRIPFNLKLLGPYKGHFWAIFMPGKPHQHRQQCGLQVEKQAPFWIRDVHAVVAFYQLYRVGLFSKEVWSWLLPLEILKECWSWLLYLQMFGCCIFAKNWSLPQSDFSSIPKEVWNLLLYFEMRLLQLAPIS